MAQSESTDTIKTQELNEVVVEASNQRTSSNVSTYIPMARQKNAAADAISLLSQMAIPQIEVDPISQAVKTASGQGVSIFIDYLSATSQDLQGMRTQDVKKVEYYLHPTRDFKAHTTPLTSLCRSTNGADIPSLQPINGSG